MLWAVDTETTLIVDNQTPDLICMTVSCDGKTAELFQGDDVGNWVWQHRNDEFIMHNAAFDVHVLEKFTGFSFEKIINEGRIYDTGIAYRLLEIRKMGTCPRVYNLGILSQKYLGITLDKDSGVRTSFSGEPLSSSQIEYAKLDAMVTYRLWTEHFCHILSYRARLSHDVQLKGSMGLYTIMQNGMGFDLKQKEKFDKEIISLVQAQEATLKSFGYGKGIKGNTKVLQAQLEQICSETHPKTTRGFSAAYDDLVEYAGQSEFIDAYLKFKEYDKLASFLTKIDKPIVRSYYNLMVDTTRTSCSSPNFQQLPKHPGIREAFISPFEGEVLVSVDYCFIELCTLAQTALWKFGKSTMADMINQGIDLHKYYAAKFLNKDIKDVTKDERQMAKAINFGKPGGLGSSKLAIYAKTSYNVNLTEDQAKACSEGWMNIFPEMAEYMAHQSEWGFAEQKILKGELDEFSEKQITSCERRTNTSREHFSLDFAKRITGVDCVTYQGFIRGRCSYTTSRNTPFQSLAACILKEAMWRLKCAGYKLVSEVHDEITCSVKPENLNALVADIERIMIEAGRVWCPDVKISVESAVTDRYSKNGKLLKDEQGNIIVHKIEV